MARFPKQEAEIAALAERSAHGLPDNISIYPQPPVHPILIKPKNTIYSSARDDFITKQAADEEATLVEQPTGKELEYRIIAVNKAGDGEPSNTAMAVL